MIIRERMLPLPTGRAHRKPYGILFFEQLRRMCVVNGKNAERNIVELAITRNTDPHSKERQLSIILTRTNVTARFVPRRLCSTDAVIGTAAL